MKEPIKVFIGYDHAEAVAYHTLCHSIMTKSSVPVSITPICLDNLKDIFTRKRDKKQSNAFSFSRFLVPYLCGYKGKAIFMDCDMLLRTDIAELFEHFDFYYAVQVVKHDYIPKNDKKYLGNVQHVYEKKNWSSVMLFNCSHHHTRKLTPEYVNTASGLELHQFKWTEEERIGEIPKEWNWLVGEYGVNPDAKIVHYTIGTPCFYEYEDCDYSEEWKEQYRDMNHCDQLFMPQVRASSK